MVCGGTHRGNAKNKSTIASGKKNTGDEPKYNFQDAQKLADEKRTSHADFSGRKPFKKYDEQFTPALPIPSAHFYDIVGNTNPPTMQVESLRREGNFVQMHCLDQEEMQTFILGLESQELNARNRISEELARCELEAMDSRHSPPVVLLKGNSVQSQSEDVKDSEEISQLAQESLTLMKVLLTPEIQSIQNRNEGRRVENGRRVAHMIGTEARLA